MNPPTTTTEQPQQLDWTEAKQHLDQVEAQYIAFIGDRHANVSFVLQIIIAPLRYRYARGERSDEPFREMLSVE